MANNELSINKTHSLYSNPLNERYASQRMSWIFSDDFKFTTWRKLWIALAQCQKELGLEISQEQIDEMKNNFNNINYERIREIESQTRHDVMAHVLAFGELCPLAKPIIHLGATSAFVGDNTDLIQIKEASVIIMGRLLATIGTLAKFAQQHKNTATLGFTHFQPAQLTTVGKRVCMWVQDLCMDAQALHEYIERLPFLGAKGATGTQASYLALFGGDHQKVKQLDRMIAEKMGFSRLIPICGQTYTRKLDSQIASLLCGIAQSLHKFSNDIRLLQHLKEIEEPFEKKQIGSSAMAFKRNPMRSERLASIARFIISLENSPTLTAAQQWLERTLDDSANKRLSIPQMFLAADAALILANNIAEGLVVYPEIIRRHIEEQLPFMATENIIMEAVKRGADRQEIHERIRQHSMEVVKAMTTEGKSNDLLMRIANDNKIGLSAVEIENICKVENFVGRAPQQVDEFLNEHVMPLIEKYSCYSNTPREDVKV